MLEKTVFFGKYHQRLKTLLTMKEKLLASYTMGVRYSSTLNLLSGKPPEVQMSLPNPNDHNNLRKILLEIMDILDNGIYIVYKTSEC